MACCGSSAGTSPVYFRLDKSSVDLCLDSYGAGAYVVPVWGAQQSHSTILTYAVIRDDPMACIARNQRNHTNSSISDPQVCVVLSSQAAGEPNVLDSWDLTNSEAFAPGMTTWGGVYLPFQAMIGWNPVSTAIDTGIVGDLYIVSPYRVGHAAVRGVCLSRDGCYCVVELDNIPTVLCVGPSGNVMRVSLLGNDSASDDDMDNDERIEASPISVCSVECADGEFAALYSDCVRVYHARRNGGLLLCCTVVVRFGGLPVMIASCPISGDIYALDSALRVYVLERARVDRAEVLHRFFEVIDRPINCPIN